MTYKVLIVLVYPFQMGHYHAHPLRLIPLRMADIEIQSQSRLRESH